MSREDPELSCAFEAVLHLCAGGLHGAGACGASSGLGGLIVQPFSMGVEVGRFFLDTLRPFAVEGRGQAVQRGLSALLGAVFQAVQEWLDPRARRSCLGASGACGPFS